MVHFVEIDHYICCDSIKNEIFEAQAVFFVSVVVDVYLNAHT